MQRKKTFSFFRYLLTFSGAALLALAIGLAYIHTWSSQAFESLAGEQTFELKRGTSLRQLAKQLENEGLVSSSELFWFWVRMRGSFSGYQSGLYKFDSNLSPKHIEKKIISGETFAPIVLEYVIPEGFSLRQVLERLEARKIGSFESLWSLANDRAFLDSLGISKQAINLEGYVYPATYSFEYIPSPKEVLKHMVESFWKNLPVDYSEQVEALGLNLHEAVIFASLIERETAIEDEKPKVSEVIWNRLKKKDALGIDAAVIYGIEDYDGQIRWRHLRDPSNPYNLRIHRGLPPGPIGAVSVSSLEAILQPTQEGYYFYVLKANSGGRHHFSKTLKEHNLYVKKLVQHQKSSR